MQTLTSADGTTIAYVRAGTGPAVVFATGAFNDHTTCADLAALLQHDHTVVTYDRRARGRSGDTTPVRDRAGDRGPRRGGRRRRVAARRCSGSPRAATWPSRRPRPACRSRTSRSTRRRSRSAPCPRGRPTCPARLAALIADGRPGDAVALFQTEGVGIPAAMVEQFRASPGWPSLVAIAQSTVYDATITSVLGVPTPAMARSTSRRSSSPARRRGPACRSPPRRWRRCSRAPATSSSPGAPTTASPRRPPRRSCATCWRDHQRCATSTTSRDDVPGPSSMNTRNGSRARTPSPRLV